MKKIFLVYSCDEWKSNDTFRLQMATTSKQRVSKYVSRQIEMEQENMLYGATCPILELTDKEILAHKKMKSAEFRKDWTNATGKYRGISIQNVNDKLIYGYIECVEDGELL